MLKIKNINKTYDNGVKALNNVSLDIPNGLFGLLGPNGAGKSSLMRTISTLQDCDTGSIHLDDLDLLNQPHEARKCLGYLPQDFNLYPHMTAKAMLTHFAALKGVGKDRSNVVQSLLEITNLWDVRDRKIGTFSGGMKRRFGIAQALLGDPRLVIVDEPTAGLDPEERQRFLNLLSSISEQVVVILSTHMVEDVRELCRNMAIIQKGSVCLTGNPEHYIQKLKGRVFEALVDKSEVAMFEDNYQVISSRFLAGRIALRLLAAEAPCERATLVTPNLEDVYFTTLKNLMDLSD